MDAEAVALHFDEALEGQLPNCSYLGASSGQRTPGVSIAVVTDGEVIFKVSSANDVKGCLPFDVTFSRAEELGSLASVEWPANHVSDTV